MEPWLTITLIITASILSLYILGALITHCLVYKTNKAKRDISNTVALITGGTSGIGEFFWIDLYLKGATVIYTGRNLKKVQKIMGKLQKKIHSSTKKDALLKDRITSFQAGTWEKDGSFHSEHLYFKKLEMGNLKSVKIFCDWFKAKFTHLDILANNAGLLLSKKRVTEEGFEFTMGVNHYAAFLLTHELYPLLKASKESRVITTSSAVHKKLAGFPDPKIDLDDLEWENSHQKYDGWHRYGNSKLANVLFTRALGRFFEKQKVDIKAVSFHPGVVRSGFWRDVKGFMKVTSFIQIPYMRSQRQGAQTLIYLGFEEFGKLSNGAFYDNCEVGVMNKLALDEKYWMRFWNLSKRELKEKTGFDLELFTKFEV